MSIPNPYFERVPQYGDLSMEKIIVDYVYPLLSVLKDSRGSRYLCMCFDTRGAQQWLITPISSKDLTALLKNEITLSAPFENTSSKKILAVRNYETKEESFLLLDAHQVPKEDLPEKGEYLDADSREWDEYISFLYSPHPSVQCFRNTIREVLQSKSAPVKWDDMQL